MAKNPKPAPNLDRLKEILDYDQSTGAVTWRISGRGIKTARAGYVDSIPDGQIDHINGCRTDNRIANLRIATHAENCRNQQKRPVNTTGFKGVVRYQDKFLAQIKKNGKGHYLGIFPTAEAAHAAYCEAAMRLYGEFARFR